MEERCKFVAMESDDSKITAAIEATLKRYDSRVIERLDDWLINFEAKIHSWSVSVEVAPTLTSRPSDLREDTEESVTSEVGLTGATTYHTQYSK